MTRKMIEMNIPFEGFHPTSKWANIMEYEIEQEIYNYVEDTQVLQAIPTEKRLDEKEFSAILHKHIDLPTSYISVAYDYAELWMGKVQETLAIPLKSNFAGIDNPKEYGKETDRIFVEIPLASTYLAFRMSRNDGHEVLNKLINEWFPKECLADWLADPLKEWNYSQVGTLFIAVLLQKKFPFKHVEEEVFDVLENDASQYLSEAINWTSVDYEVEWEMDKKAKDKNGYTPFVPKKSKYDTPWESALYPWEPPTPTRQIHFDTHIQIF